MKANKILKNKVFLRIAAVLLTLAVWQAAAALLDSSIFLVGPWQVLMKVFELSGKHGFLSSVWFSLWRIAVGWTAGVAVGSLLGAAAGKWEAVRILLRPLMVSVRTVPVASFIVIALVWLSSAQLSVFISFLMVLPIVYTNALQGILNLDVKMEQMSRVFRMSPGRKLRYVTLPQLKPYIISACSVSAGLAWKAGITAEIIGVPTGSMGERLYQAKIYLDTAELLAWTVVIVAVSVIFEKLFILVLKKAFESVERR